LDINVEYQVHAAFPGQVEDAPVGPVIVAKYLSPFEKLVALQHLLKLFRLTKW